MICESEVRCGEVDIVRVGITSTPGVERFLQQLPPQSSGIYKIVDS